MRHGVGAVVVGLALAAGSYGCQVRDCEDTRAAAEKLSNEVQACSGTDECELVDFYDLAGTNNCLGPFQCSQPVRKSVDRDDLGRRARAIAEDYRQCDECSSASCPAASALTAFCNTTTGRCETKAR